MVILSNWFQSALKSTLKILFMCSLGFNALTAFADPPPASHHYWRNSNYPNHYVLYDAKTRQWVETIDCRVAYRFRAIKNELNNLTLYDDSRGMTVLVNYDGMFLKAAGAVDFSFYQRGTFDTERPSTILTTLALIQARFKERMVVSGKSGFQALATLYISLYRPELMLVVSRCMTVVVQSV